MKKLTCLPAGKILPIILIISFLFFLPQKTYSQVGPECMKIFDKEMKDCTTDFNTCSDVCQEETKKPDGTAYFNSGEIYPKCMKANQCHEKSEACKEQALTNYRACGKSDKSTEAKQENPKQDGVPVFIGEWFSRFSQAIDGLTALTGAFTDVVYEDKFYLAGDFPKLSEMNLENFYQGNWYPNDDTLDRSPDITDKDEQKAWDFDRLDTPPTEKVNITLLQGEAQIKSPESPQFIPIDPKGGDTQQVTFLDSTVRSTTNSVQLRHTWSPDSGAVINMSKWSEIKFREPVEVEGVTSHTVELGQGEIEAKVRNSKPAENQFGIDAGWLGVTVSRTHFWVSQSQDKKLAVVGVYEGEVEVKTKDGKTIKVKPDSNKPGIVVVTQKLSPLKLALAGLVLMVTVGSIILIIRKKFTSTGLNKKKK